MLIVKAASVKSSVDDDTKSSVDDDTGKVPDEVVFATLLPQPLRPRTLLLLDVLGLTGLQV